MTAYQVVARNFSTSSENRMHSDEMASRYGFRGALVPGVAIYGHLVKPFIDRFGASWLGDSSLEVKLIKPTYHGDQLNIQWSDANDGVAATNQHGELVAIIANRTVTELPEDLGLEGELKIPGRPEICWDNVCVGEVFSPRGVEA